MKKSLLVFAVLVIITYSMFESMISIFAKIFSILSVVVSALMLSMLYYDKD